jgi:hypothetical protein
MRVPRFVATAVLLALSALALAYAVRVPAVVPATAPSTVFSAERAMGYVRELSQRPHPSGSAEHQRLSDYIMGTLASFGLEPLVQETIGIGTRYAVAGSVRNIMVRVMGTYPGRAAVLLTAHYDGVPAGPAASDDGAGTAVLLETLRAIRQGQPLRHDVIALFTDSEEAGLLGAAAFVREHQWANDVSVVLNFEARGTHGPSLMFETGAGNADVVRVLRRVRGARATSLSTAVYRQLPNDTDLSELLALGKPAMNFAFIGGVERYHTAEDDIAHLSAGSLQHHGNQALALTRAFAQGQLPRPVTGDAVFFDLPLLGLVMYSEPTALALAIVTLLVGIAALVIAARRDRSVWKGAGLGAAALVVSLVLAMAIAAGTAALLGKLHAALAGGGAPQWRGIYSAAIALLTFAIVAVHVALGGRFANVRNLALGAVLVLNVLSLYLAVAMPGVGYLFTWPVLFATIALVADAADGRAVIREPLRWLSAGVAIFLLVPTTYLMVSVALGLDIVGSAALAALATVTTWLLGTHFQALAMDAGGRWRLPAMAGAAGLLALTVGAITVRTDVDRPAGAALVYAIDSDSLTGWITGGATTPAARRWLEGATGAIRGEQGGATPPQWISRSFGARFVAPAPVADVPAPSATVLSDSATATERRVRLRILPGGALQSIVVTADPGAVTALTVDGRPVDQSRYRSRPSRLNLQYVAPRPQGFLLDLTLRASSDPGIALLGRRTGIPSLARFELPVRPPGIIPIQQGDVTYIYRRVPLPPRRP